MRYMFGQDPNIQWQVLDISASEIPNVAQVIVSVGAQQPPIRLYVTPDGEHAIVGEVIPFGADPFAPARHKLEAEAHGVARGAAKPAVTLVEFSDLQCPHCKVGQPIIDKLLQDFPDARLIFQPFPLAMHKWAMKAAAAAECVAQQNSAAFWKFIQSVYEAQETITEANADQTFAGLATAAGVNAQKTAACSASPDTARRVQQSLELGKAVGVNSTPTLFVNGRRVPGVKDVPYESLKALVTFAASGKTPPLPTPAPR